MKLIAILLCAVVLYGQELVPGAGAIIGPAGAAGAAGATGATGATGPNIGAFALQTASAPAFSATPTFSLADVSTKSPVRFEPGAMTAAVTAVTFSNKTAGAKFSIVWLEDGTGGRALTHGASAAGTCETNIPTAANAYTEQFYEVSADGTTVTGVGCITNQTGIGTATNCSSTASPAVCAAAAAGSIAFPTGVTSVALTVNTTAVTANSQIFVFPDDTLGTKLGITCNSTLATLVGGMAITTRTAGTSFEVTFNGTIATNKLCASYLVIN